MPVYSGQKQQDVFERLEEHRQQLKAWQEQLEDFEKRLKLFRQRQLAFQAQLETLHVEQQYLKSHLQEVQRKHAERGW